MALIPHGFYMVLGRFRDRAVTLLAIYVSVVLGKLTDLGP